MSGRQSYTSAAPQHFPEVFLHLGQLLCMSAHVFACRANVSLLGGQRALTNTNGVVSGQRMVMIIVGVHILVLLPKPGPPSTTLRTPQYNLMETMRP